MRELNTENWSENLKRFHKNLNQVNEELELITPEIRSRCDDTLVDTVLGDKIVFQHSFPCDGDTLWIAVEGNTRTGDIELTHFKWVETNEENA